MSELIKAINNYMAVNNKNNLTEEEALELLKKYNNPDDSNGYSLESNEN